MDAVELNLPANVAVRKILGPEAREFEEADLAAQSKASGFGSSHEAMANQIFINGGSDIDGHNEIATSKLEANGRRDGLGEADRCDVSMPFSEDKEGNRKTTTNPSILPCLKRQRADPSETVLTTGVLDRLSEISKKNGKDTAEKLRKIKQKCSLDNKKNDKRSVRSGGKNKEAVIATSDLLSGASSILGLKPEFKCITKLEDEIALDELLGGSCRSSEVSPDKGKKPANCNYGILQSIRKASSVLASHSGTFSSSNKKCSTCFRHLNDCSLKIPSSDDVFDSFATSGISREAKFNSQILHHPKEILDQLALPPSHDLDTLLSGSIAPNSLQPVLHPLPWSLSHTSGTCKANSESGKSANSVRSTFQGRWVRVARNFPSTSESKAGSNEDVEQKKIADLLQFVNSLSISSNVQISDNSASAKESRAVFSCNPYNSILQKGKSSSDNDFCLGLVKYEEVPMCSLKVAQQVDSSKIDFNCSDREVGTKAQSMKTCSTSSYLYPCAITSGGVGQSSCQIPDQSDDSPSLETLYAARILCDMASSSSASKRPSHDDEVKELAGVSHGISNYWKSTSSVVGKPEVLGSKPPSAVESSGQLSSKHHSSTQKVNSFRGGIGWIAEGSLDHGRSNKETGIKHNKSVIGGFSRQSGPGRPHIMRSEQVLGSPRMLQSFVRSPIKEWNKGRNRRL